MELTLHLSATPPIDTIAHSPSLLFIPNKFLLSRLKRIPFRPTRIQVRNREVLLETQQLQRNQVVEEEENGEIESFSDDEDSALLSLSVKPDRNMALLDDYEMEELDFQADPNHKSGYVAVLGWPNVGKSTLSNQMVGQKLSIVTNKPQTTRHRVLGICSAPEYQMILYDTPGVIEKKMHKLDSMMMKNVWSATVNADCVVIVVDACKIPQKIDDMLEEGVGSLKENVPKLLVMKKKDLIKPGEIAKRIEWYEKFTDVDEVMPVSAKYGHGVDDVKDWIVSKLPLGPAYYPKDGKALKLLATAARLDIEDFLQKKVYLEVEVKVKENWRQDESLLKYYGYGGQIRAM